MFGFVRISWVYSEGPLGIHIDRYIITKYQWAVAMVVDGLNKKKLPSEMFAFQATFSLLLTIDVILLYALDVCIELFITHKMLNYL